MTNHNSWEEFTSLPTTITTTTTIMETTSPPSSSSSSSSSHPLFSTLVTLYLLLVLYLPNPFFSIFLSPLLISTSILLFLLRLGTSQQPKPQIGSPRRVSPDPGPVTQPEPVTLGHGTNQLQEAEAPCNRIGIRPSNEPGPKPEPQSFYRSGRDVGLIELREGPDPHCCGPEPDEKITGKVGTDLPDQEGRPEPDPPMGPKVFCRETYVGWEVGAPLEVIYEAYEGEEEGDDQDENDSFQNNFDGKIGRYPSLSRYYPESDSGSDSECSSSSREEEFPGMELWNGEEERDELIEIALDYYVDEDGINKKMILKEVQIIDNDDDDDEDNLIEIDISPTRADSGFCWRDEVLYSF